MSEEKTNSENKPQEKTEKSHQEQINDLIKNSLKITDYEEFYEKHLEENIIYIDEIVDLKYLCELMVKDDEEKVEELMVKKLLFTPDRKFLDEMLQANPEIRYIKIAPYMLFQLVKDED